MRRLNVRLVRLDPRAKHHGWSALSLAISVGTAFTLLCFGEYQHHVHHVTDLSRGILPILGGGSVLASVSTGVIAMVKENASPVSLLALGFGLFSFMFYAV